MHNYGLPADGFSPLEVLVAAPGDWRKSLLLND
jgi:hypothetical protein